MNYELMYYMALYKFARYWGYENGDFNWSEPERTEGILGICEDTEKSIINSLESWPKMEEVIYAKGRKNE